MYYLAFSGREFDGYDPETDIPLLRAKICYAIFGSPQFDADTIENAYDDKQRKEAQKIVDVILEIRREAEIYELSVGIIFIYCKESEKEYLFPVFRIYTGTNKPPKFVDVQHRVYNSWKDWKENNRLPMLEYCYPKNGYFSCDNESYMYDAAKNPVLEYGKSPACDLLSRFARIGDYAATGGSLTAALVGTVAFFSPVGWIAAPILAGNIILGGISATYGLGRGIQRLCDKAKHGESLTDIESATLWLSVAAFPFQYISSLANTKLATGAAQGRTFSYSIRIFATTLNCTNLGMNEIMVGFGLSNLIEKHQRDDLNSLDVLQFSMSVFFFSHTLMQPITANAVIQRSQSQYIQQYAKNMKDSDTKAALNNFLERNRGGMEKDSKVIRSINKVNDPNSFFKGCKESTIDIGGRKGNTFIVKDAHGRTNRINPNRTFFDAKSQKPVQDLSKFQNFLGGKKLDEYVLNDKKIFKNLNDRQKERIGKMFGDSTNFNKEIFDTAGIVAKSLGVKDADQFMSVIEIVLADIKGIKGKPFKTSRLGYLQSAGKDSFVQSITKDLTEAKDIAKNANFAFSDPYKAVYHYRKHGAEFPSKIPGNSIDFYLGTLPDKIIRDANLAYVWTYDDGAIKKIYTTSKNNFAVVVETPNKQIICTMFQRKRFWEKYISKVEQPHNNVQSVKDAAELLANSLGFREMHIFVIENGSKKSISETENLDPKVHEQIAKLLTEFSISEDDSSDDDD